MADYIRINNYSKLGEMGISRQCIAAITEKAVKNVPGVKLESVKEAKGRKGKDKADKPIKVYLRSNGKADIYIEVAIKDGIDIGSTCLAIQKSVADTMQMMVETVPVSVNIKVSRVA
ncbi:MAG: Asp23/Gls24 family envelope stress response protein [Bacillota bacterium]|nr:Asp23/Gls24 family envelope stress response protein [Bacillota bacterium]